MIVRKAEKVLRDALRRSPSAVLTGPRQVGKTTLALQLAESIPAVYLDLENRTDLLKAREIEAFYSENRGKLLILDEVHRLPELFQTLRGLIDHERRRGRGSGLFLFLGSASLDLLRQSGESLAGRLAQVELFPINVSEYVSYSSSKRLNTLWLRGGFPESLLASSDRDSIAWRLDFIRTYLQRDIPQLGPRIAAETLERFWTMLAHNQGNLFNAASLAKALEVSATTVARYLDLMAELLLIRRLKPWTQNIGKRLVRSPKVYVRDSGLVHALLNIPEFNDLLGHPVAGRSWEGFVIENILSVLPSWVRPYFYRTSGGAEIDLLLEFSPGELWAVEIKRSTTPTVPKGFYIACEDLKAARRFVVYAGEEQFTLAKDIRAIPLPEFMEALEKMSANA